MPQATVQCAGGGLPMRHISPQCCEFPGLCERNAPARAGFPDCAKNPIRITRKTHTRTKSSCRLRQIKSSLHSAFLNPQSFPLPEISRFDKQRRHRRTIGDTIAAVHLRRVPNFGSRRPTAACSYVRSRPHCAPRALSQRLPVRFRELALRACAFTTCNAYRACTMYIASTFAKRAARALSHAAAQNVHRTPAFPRQLAKRTLAQAVDQQQQPLQRRPAI